MTPERLFELRRRTFDTPEFRGMTFIEVEAKSVINKVPAASRMPFDYTINPYRGCSHACTYCIAGDTPILMADGRAVPVAKVSVGDRVYGTEARGRYRRYVPTSVLAHWETAKPAYRVTLEDGTELISSGDHRFLTERGWKHVTGTEHGLQRRPFLTTNNAMIGVGGFAAPPIEDEGYRRGYLCGMIRGDGHVGSYVYPDAVAGGRAHTRFRLALVDDEALDRTAGYLGLDGVDTTRFGFHPGTATHKPVHAIRTQRRVDVELIRSLIAWPLEPSASWRKGFLAGIFDAEGTCARDVVRISNTNDLIIAHITDCLEALEFSYVVEDRANGLRNVRLLGGFRERLAFVHTVDPAITRKRTFDGLALKSNAPLRVVSIESLGIDMPMFDITTGTGDFIANGVVSHNCFARPTHTYLDMDAGRDFESKIVVKVNAPEVVRRELAKRSWKGDHIAMGTNTDPYQRAEGRYRLMRGILEALRDARNPFSILTKGTLIVRDIDLLQDAARHASVSAAFSIGTMDEQVWRRTEPGTPHPKARMEAVRALGEAGIPTGVLLAPVLPGISDAPRQLRDVVAGAIDAGATHVSPVLLHLRPGVREEFMPWLEKEFPDLVPRYRALYPRSYAPSRTRSELSGRVTSLIRAMGGLRPAVAADPFWRGDQRPGPRDEPPEQLTLVG
jgi:DNA repair photolyase